MIRFLFAITIALFSMVFSLNAQTVTNIVQGYVSQTSTNFCVMMDQFTVLKFELIQIEAEQLVAAKEVIPNKDFCYDKKCAVKVEFEKLKPNTDYRLQVYEAALLHKTINFTTNNKTVEIRDFTIITGSCSFTPVGWSKLLFPFLKLKIYNAMQQANAEFMLWLGDTVYYLNDDTQSRKVRRHILYRQREKLIQFLTSTPQIAMWDDHDFGPNNADGSYKDKMGSLAVFNQFWPNPTSVEADGMYFKISRYDVDFFILDNRSYSNKNTSVDATILGHAQKKWLKAELKKSKASFKIICSGNQFIADYLSDKTFALYPKERQEIFDFLLEHNVEGVFFLTGDRHHTEVLKKEVDGLYTMYEYSCSPVTSWPNAKLNSMRFNKKQRVKGTLLNQRNFGKMSFVGDKTNRICLIKTFNQNGKLKGTLEIKAKDLRF